MRIYLALQVFKDGRIMFRRWTPDNASGAPSGGVFQAQTLDALYNVDPAVISNIRLGKTYRSVV